VIKKEGESYRLSLQRRIRELGLDKNVLFHPRFVELDELLEYIGAADIFVAPYLNLDQATSGALAYAMGAGKAVIATPFPHAVELLADGRGRLVPARDSQALAQEVIALLDNEAELSAVRKRAYKHCRNMVWSAVARSYLDLAETIRSQTQTRIVTTSALRRPLAATNLPAPKIDHIERLTDGTGPAHHSRYTIPVWSHGYRLDDAAASLVATIKYNAAYKDVVSARLAETNLAFIDTMIGPGGEVASGMNYLRQVGGRANDIGVGKVLWALGYVAQHELTRLANPAIDMFNDLLPQVKIISPEGAGYAVLGASNYLSRFAGASDVKRLLVKQVETLAEFCERPDWIDQWNGDDSALALQAIAVAGATLDDDKLRELSRSLADMLLERTARGTEFRSHGTGQESPIFAAIFIEGLGALFQNTQDPTLLEPIRRAADWFLGANRLRTALYDFSTGGCHDELTATGVNRNQGTEATVYCLLAFLTLHSLASLEPPATEEHANADQLSST